MFTTLQELAKKATLMITVAPEGADQLRVNVTPVPADTKAKHNLPQPLSLVATPAEFDTDFAAALLNWQAPKRSLIQQVQDATGAAAAPAAAVGALALPAPKAESKPEKAGRKPRAGKGAEDDKKNDQAQDAVAGGDDAASAGDQAADASSNTSGQDTTASTGANVPGEALAPASDAVAGAAGAAVEVQPLTETPPAPAPAGAGSERVVDVHTLDLF